MANAEEESDQRRTIMHAANDALGFIEHGQGCPETGWDGEDCPCGAKRVRMRLSREVDRMQQLLEREAASVL